MEAKHTPTPWFSPAEGQVRSGEGDELIAKCCAMEVGGYRACLENAEFIVRACNSHEQLIKALRAAESAIETSEDCEPQMIAALSQVCAALAAAGAA
jgi:hypothetical protein